MRKSINLELDKPEESAAVLKAIASPERLKILKCITVSNPSPNVKELAEKLDLPITTTSLHVRVLEKAGLIYMKEIKGLRNGTQKICILFVQDIHMNFKNPKQDENQTRNIQYSMPLGNYFDCKVTRPCGMAGKKNPIGIDDSTQVFYSSSRLNAQIVWFTSGFLEYRFPNLFANQQELLKLSFSFEACSEAPDYNNDWPSDITVWINNNEVFTFRSAGDFGGKRGILNPDWWPEHSSQYGELHQIEITRKGCFGDGKKHLTKGFRLSKLRRVNLSRSKSV